MQIREGTRSHTVSEQEYKKGGDEYKSRGNGERRGREMEGCQCGEGSVGGERGWTVGSGVNSVIIVISPSRMQGSQEEQILLHTFFTAD